MTALRYASQKQQLTPQQLPHTRVGRLIEFLSFRFPAQASAAMGMIIDDELEAPKMEWEEKIRLLAFVGCAFPKFVDASIGLALDRVEILLGNIFFYVFINYLISFFKEKKLPFQF